MNLSFAVILITLALTSFFGVCGIIIWSQRNRYTRERFALLALFAILALSVMLLASFATDFIPWYTINALFQMIEGSDISVPAPRWSDYALLFLLYVMIVQAIIQLHRGWDGLKSVPQHNREQRSEAPSLFVEAIEELRRLVKGQPAWEVYSTPSWKEFITPLEPITDSLTWAEEARELIRLSSSSYVFEEAAKKDEQQGYWVGTNLDTGNLVFLYPAQSALNESRIKKFVGYANHIAAKQDKAADELIIAMKNGYPASPTNLNGTAIRVESESDLLRNLVNLWDYRNDIRKRVAVNHLPDSTLSLNEVYVPSRFYLPKAQQPSDNLEQYLLGWLDEPGQRQLALLGEYGQGKSTAALMFTYHLLCDPQAKRIPIQIELRGMSPRNLTPLELLGTWAVQYRINAQALMLLLRAGRLVLIFDGFDEMALVGDAQMRLKHFKTLWQFCYPQAKILLTGRPNFFLDDEEMKAALGISEPVDDRPYCEALRLAAFDVRQIETSLRAHNPSVREQISRLAQNNQHFRELVSRPSLLHIVSVLWVREGLAQQVDKLNSAYIMKLFVQHSYRRQERKKSNDHGNFMALTTSERDYFMSGIASYMAANQLPNQISGSDLNQLIETLIKHIPDSVSIEPSALSDEMNMPLRQRLQDTEDHIEWVKTDVRSCGLLVSDPASSGAFRFGHKSFMEYLFAAVVAERILEENSVKTKAILKATEANIEDILTLSVSIEFLSELIRTTHKLQPHESSLSKDGEQAYDDLYTASIIFNKVFNLNKTTIYFAKSYYFINYTILEIIYLFIRKRLLYSDFNNFSIIIIINKFFNIIFYNEKYNVFEYISKKMQLWDRLCKEIGIPDHIMHRVAGTWLLPWVRNQPFDYFLDEDEKKRYTK